MDHFESVGFQLSNLNEYLAEAFKSGARRQSATGEYRVLHDPSGSSVIFALRKEGILRRLTVQSASPHFKGSSRNRIQLQAIKADPPHMEAECLAWMNPQRSETEGAEPDSRNCSQSGAFPFTFNLAFADTAPEQTLPRIAIAQLTGFPHQHFSIVRNDSDLENFWSGLKKPTVAMGGKAFIPESTFSGGPPCVSFLSGIVADVQECKNGTTGIDYFVCMIESYECQLDLVLSARQVNQRPERGNRFIGRVWISGELMD